MDNMDNCEILQLLQWECGRVKNELAEFQKKYMALHEELNSLQRAIQVCEKSSRGIFKRIDENRELLETLRKEAPSALEHCPWIEDWIAGNDRFFYDLVHAIGLENISGQARIYPRPWPGR